MMRQFYRARIKLSDELKKGENIQKTKSLKNQNNNKKMRKYPSLIPKRYLLSKEGNAELVVECLVSSPSSF